MQHAVRNRATIRVADRTDVSGRATADSIKHELYAKRQSSLWRLTIFGFCKVCSLVAATLILPTLTYAQNNQGNGRPGFNLGIPNGTYVFNITGLFTPTTTLAPVAAVTRITYTPNATGSGGTTSGVASYSFAPPGASTVLFTGVPVVGFFTVQEMAACWRPTYRRARHSKRCILFRTLHLTPTPLRSLRPIPERLPPGLAREDASLTAAGFLLW